MIMKQLQELWLLHASLEIFKKGMYETLTSARSRICKVFDPFLFKAKS